MASFKDCCVLIFCSALRVGLSFECQLVFFHGKRGLLADGEKSHTPGGGQGWDILGEKPRGTRFVMVDDQPLTHIEDSPRCVILDFELLQFVRV